MDIILLEGLSPLSVNLHDAARGIVGAELPGSRIWMLSDDHHFLYEGPPIDLERVSRGFLDSLLAARASDEERQRPIVFVGIAMGGILVEQAFFLTHGMEEFTHIREHLAGVVFLGMPHGDGQDLGYVEILRRLGAGSTHFPETTADGLAVNSAYFNLLTFFFRDHIKDVPVYTITHPDLLVGERSATLGCNREVSIPMQIPDDIDGHLSILQEVCRSIRVIKRQHNGLNPIRRGGERVAAYTIEDLPPDICPICSTLPRDVRVGPQTAVLTHTISLAQSAQDELRLWARRCILANFAHRVSIDWLGRREPAGMGRGLGCQERTLWGNMACVGQEGVEYGGMGSSSSDENGTCIWALDFKRPDRKAWWWAINTEQDDTHYRNGQRVVHRDPLSESVVQLLGSWMKLCDEVPRPSDHRPAFLPSRLLDVRNLDRITLVDSANLEICDDQIKYATLSHCWGSSRAFLTTRRNLPKMKEGFSLTEAAIPKTFSDAIKVAQRLRIPYLWIDSLCIIQDDPGDWAVESSRMANVYSNSYLTVSAACSISDETGFLHPRPFQYAAFKLNSPTGEKAVAYLREEGEVGPRFWVRDEPLFRRAWVFQEQFHSRRTLIFFKSEMAIYCRSASGQSGSGFIRTESNTAEAKAAVERNFMSVNNLSWRTIIRDLSKRLLSYDSDKLPCIAGVASTFSTAREGSPRQYCSGLWRDSLPPDLLFCRGEKVERPQTYTAPSWSWAALSGPIVWLGEAGEVNNAPDTPTEYETFGILDSARVFSCNAILEDERSPYGKVLEGSSMTLHAHFVELERCGEDSMQSSDIPEMPSWQFEPRYLWPAKARKVMGELFRFRLAGVERFAWCRFDLFSFGLKNIIGIPVASRRWGFDESSMRQPAGQLEEGDALVGILVTPFSGNGPHDGYRRVGVFEIPSAGIHPQQTLDGLPSQTFVLY